MATVVFGAIGAGIGSIFHNPLLGWEIGTVVGGLLFPGKRNNQERNKLADVRVTGSNYGVDIPRVWGNFRVAGNIIWSTDLVEHRHQSGGGGSGGGQQSVTDFSYSVSCAVLLCEGQISTLKRIWFEKTVVWDSDNPSASKIASQITFYPGNYTQTADPTIYADLTTKQGKPTPAFRGRCYIVFNGIDLSKYGNRLPNMEFEIQSTASVSAQNILEDVCTICGLIPADYDFSAASSLIVSGYISPGRETGRQIIEPLTDIFPADLVEIDGKIKWISRGMSEVFNIPVADLGAAYWQGGQPVNSPPVSYMRLQDVEIPATFDITYYTYHPSDKSLRSYLQGGQHITRPSKATNANSTSLTLPAAISDTLARQIASRKLYTAWIEQEKYSTSIGPKYAYLSPGDVGFITAFGATKRVRITQIEGDPIGVSTLSFVLDNVNVLDQSNIIAGTTGGTAGSFYSGIGSLIYYAWCGNALRDEDIGGSNDIPGFYFCASWPAGLSGATVYMSNDNALSFKQIETIPAYTIMGNSATALASFPNTAVFDNVNTVDVTLSRGELSGTDYWGVLSGENAILLGEEVIQYMNADLINPSTNRWRLSGLLRGQRGTEYFGGQHTIGEVVIGLSMTIQRHRLNFGYLNKDVILRFVPTGGTLAGATNFPLTISGKELKPYAGCQLSGTRDGSLNATISWVRRTRKSGQWQDYNDVPVSEGDEAYTVLIYDNTYSNLKRTLTSSTPSVTYSITNQTADFGSAQSIIYVRVYQTNSMIGLGYKLEGAI